MPTTGLLLLQLVLDIRPGGSAPREVTLLAPARVRRSQPSAVVGALPAAGDDRGSAREALAFVALLGLTALVWAAGVVLAVPLSCSASWSSAPALSWWRALALALAAFVVLYLGFPNLLGIELPRGHFLDLRSPLWL